MWTIFFYLVIGASACLLGAFAVTAAAAGIRSLADRWADRRGVPIEGPARPRRTSSAWLSAVLSGGVTRQKVLTHDVRKVLRRRYGKRGA